MMRPATNYFDSVFISYLDFNWNLASKLVSYFFRSYKSHKWYRKYNSVCNESFYILFAVLVGTLGCLYVLHVNRFVPKAEASGSKSIAAWCWERRKSSTIGSLCENGSFSQWHISLSIFGWILHFWRFLQIESYNVNCSWIFVNDNYSVRGPHFLR